MMIDSPIAGMDAVLRLPGVSNAWSMPIKAWIDRLSTGMRTPIGVMVHGPGLAEIDHVSPSWRRRCRRFPALTAGRRPLFWTCSPIALSLPAARAGETVTATVEGRARYTENRRYPRTLRSDPQAIATLVPVQTPRQSAAAPLMPPGQRA